MVAETKNDALEADLEWVGNKAPDLLDPRLTTHELLPDIHHPQSHSHPTHGDINFTGTVSADGDEGLTGQRTVGGYKLTFKKGLLVGFEAV